jgi:flagellar hook-associated protein 1
MAGLRGLLDTARSSLLAQQWAMQITGHNLANVNTDGYTRQRGVMRAREGSSNRQLGIGAGIESLQSVRLRQNWMDQELRRQASTFGESSMRSSLLQGIENRIGAPGENGLGTDLDAFWAEWSSLSAAPEDSSARQALLDSSDRLVQGFQQLHRGLVAQREDQNMHLEVMVSEVNSLSESIASLNQRIQSAEQSGGVAADLRDQRDQHMDELAGLVDVQWEEGSQSQFRIWLGGRALVDGVHANALQTVSESQDDGSRLLQPRWADGSNLEIKAGSMAGLLQVRDEVIPQKLAELDQMALALVQSVNALHMQGHDLHGTTGAHFFDPATTGAANIGVSSALVGDPSLLAVSADGGVGNGSIASQIAALAASELDGLNAQTLSESWAGFVSDVGFKSRRAEEALATDETFLLDLEARRQSASGVSIDEEMTILLQQEQAYAASARVLAVAEELMDEILRLV